MRPGHAFSAYLVFVVYGSLVPFEYRGVTLQQAFQQFAAIPWLDLGIVSRADWIANLVLYLPLAFLGCHWAVGLRPLAQSRHLALPLVLAFCAGVAVAVEFIQIFFAPRTVSLNDLLAEILGSLAGVGLFAAGRRRIAHLLDQFAQGGRKSALALGTAYALAYIALALFPYDFVLSREELAWKLAAGQQGWLLVDGCGGLICLARQAGEILAILPLGLLIARALPDIGYRRLFLLGCGLGLGLELTQLLLASGYSQGLSVPERGLGLVAGAALDRSLRALGPGWMARTLRRIIPFAALPYLLLLAKISGWLSPPWLPAAAALDRLGQVRFLPFYYHYYSTEMVAMSSLLSVAGMYAPVGVAVWAWRGWRGGAGPGLAGLAALALDLPMEAGKLWVPPRHPDPTNLLIAAVGAALAYVLLDWTANNLAGKPDRDPAPDTAAPAPAPWPQPHPLGLAVALAAGAAIATGLAWYPTGTPWLALALSAYGILLWRRPSLLFLLLPALLPVLDLRPYTGDLLLNEFDLAVLVALAIGYWRAAANRPAPWPNRWLGWAIALLWTSWALSSLRGPWPPAAPLAGLPPSSHSPLEAWQVGKGLLWALLLVPLMRRIPPAYAETMRDRLLAGLVAGLAVEVLAVLWERQVFVGLGDFDNVFRVTGTFADMRTGGAYIEAFLALCFPVLAARTLAARHRGWKLGGGVLALGAVYAMLVTFSRGGYAGLVLGLVPVALGMLRPGAGAAPHRRWALAGLVLVATAAVPVLSGGFAQQRLARSSQDFAIRLAHWRNALDLMDGGPTAALAGMGFGQYPLLYLLRGDGPHPPGTYSLLREDGNTYLRLGAGESTFLEQVVALRPNTPYTLSARLRRERGGATLEATLCAKALLYSFACADGVPPMAAAGPGWRGVDVEWDSGDLGRGWRTVKLSLHNPGGGEPLDLDDISLKGPDGRELLENGGFGRGAAGWLFAADQDLAWHIHQMAVELYVAQGGLGLAALVALLAGTGRALGPGLWAGRLPAAGLAGGIVGFLAVGLLGSTMDAPRLSMLFYLCCFGAGLWGSGQRGP